MKDVARGVGAGIVIGLVACFWLSAILTGLLLAARFVIVPLAGL